METSQTEFYALLISIVRALVDRPNEVRVIASGTDGSCYQIQVDQLDLGKIIGKQGRTARAIRLLAIAHGQKINRRISIEIAQGTELYSDRP
jgi:predicted RNA-binding protein YlqC (UPF0109 family)